MIMSKQYKNLNYKYGICNYLSYWNNTTELLPNYIIVNISRFNIKDYQIKSNIDTFYVTREQTSTMLLDLLFYLQEFTPDLTFRRSCREGICGSCSMNINGINTLACLFKLKNFKAITKFISNSVVCYNKLVINPLPHMPIVKDLVVSMDHFYNQYKEIMPYRITNSVVKNHDSLMVTKKVDRALIDGIYECILCACCSTSCPSYWWNAHTYLGPAILLQAFRWIVDVNDHYIYNRLSYLNDSDKLNKCHNIMNCSLTCPKGLKPAEAIVRLKYMASTININTNMGGDINYMIKHL